MKGHALLVTLLALLLAALWFKGGLTEPAPVPDRVAPGEFDTLRAIGRLARILGDEAPHPVDSDEADAVRRRLVGELRSLGLEPAVTDDLVCNGRESSRTVSCARVRNVLARIGPPAGPAVMMASHYDSTPVGPGAADDGIGMAVMLEAAALLRQSRLERPVLLLFDEGEEAGLLGARAFVERNPLARDVAAVVNLEARGVGGPAIMFETSRPNGPAVRAYARSAERPMANSLSADFYAMLPNDTDASIFRELPWTILNFAIVGNETRYHSPGDDLLSLDPRSVRHMGEQALAATAVLAAGDAASGGGRLAYADLLGRRLVAIPLWLSGAALAALFLLFLWLAQKRRAGLGLAAATIAVALADAAILGFLGQWAVGLFRDGEWWRAHPQVSALALCASALATGLAALLVLGRRLARDRLRLAFWLLFLILGAGLSLAAPGASIFFLAPPLVAGAAMLAGRWERPAALVAWALLFLSWAPILHQAEILLDMDRGWMFAPVAGLLVLPVLIELKPLAARMPTSAAVAAILLLPLAGWTAAALAPAYSPERRQAFGIEYVREPGRARWMVVNDGAPVPLPGFEAGVEVPWSARKRWTGPAPALPVEPPRLEKIAERVVADGRLLTLRLASGGAEMLLLRAEPHAGLRAVRVGGKVRRFGRGKPDEDFVLRCHGRSCDGLVLDLLVASRSPVEAVLAGSRRGLPDAAAPLLAARPRNAAPQYNPDATIALTRVRL